MSQAQAWCALAAARGLVAHDSVDLSDDDVASLLDEATERRVVGLVAAAVVDGALRVSAASAERIAERNAAALHQCLFAEEVAVLAAEALRGRGVPFRVLKGIAIAHLDETDPALRHFGDADMLVPRRSYTAALEALAAAGFRRDEPAVRGWWEQRFGKAVMFVAPNGAELDLHFALVDGWFGAAASIDDLWQQPADTVVLAGVSLDTVARPVRLVHAAYHAVLGGGSGVRALRDVALLATGPPQDWAAARSLAASWRGEAILAEAVRRAWTVLGLDADLPPAMWAAAAPPDAADQQRLAVYDRPLGSDWAAEGRSALPAMPWAQRVPYLLGLAFPSRASLRHRGRTLPQHLWRSTVGRFT